MFFITIFSAIAPLHTFDTIVLLAALTSNMSSAGGQQSLYWLNIKCCFLFKHVSDHDIITFKKSSRYLLYKKKML